MPRILKNIKSAKRIGTQQLIVKKLILYRFTSYTSDTSDKII